MSREVANIGAQLPQEYVGFLVTPSILSTRPDKPEGISHATGEGSHTTKHSGAWKRKELEGCCAPLCLEGKMHTTDAAPFCFSSFQDEN